MHDVWQNLYRFPNRRVDIHISVIQLSAGPFDSGIEIALALRVIRDVSGSRINQ